MKRIWKRVLSCLLAAILLCGLLAAPALAAPPDRMENGRKAAERLYELGLFKGTGTLPDGTPDFALDSMLTRGEAVALITRLLGAEQEALAAGYPHPFTDVSAWAAPYVGYAYRNQITKGVSETSFCTDGSAGLNIFVTLLVRALGYSETIGGGDWANPWPAADSIGLYHPGADSTLYRADAALICLDALDCQVQGENRTLYEKLEQAGVLGGGEQPQPPAEAFVPGPAEPLVTAITASSPDEFLAELAAATLGHAETIAAYTPAGSAALYINYLHDTFHGLSAPFSEANGYSGRYYDDFISLSPLYTDAARIMAWLEGRADGLSTADRQLFDRAREIHASLVSPGMSEYEQVRAFHDWLVNNNQYDQTYRDASYDAYGALLTGFAVCDGYAKAFDLLCYLSGIECLRINGKAASGGTAENHAWNKVNVDGRWYNVDVTWDDPVTANGQPVLRYDYFLVSDSTLASDHQWSQYSFWPDCPSDYQ